MSQKTTGSCQQSGSHPKNCEVGPDVVSLRQMGSGMVASLCLSSLAIAGSSTRVKSAVSDFKEQRTPWAATELANVLAAWDPGNPHTADLIDTLYREAELCAGLPLPNKLRRAS